MWNVGNKADEHMGGEKKRGKTSKKKYLEDYFQSENIQKLEFFYI